MPTRRPRGADRVLQALKRCITSEHRKGATEAHIAEALERLINPLPAARSTFLTENRAPRYN